MIDLKRGSHNFITLNQRRQFYYNIKNNKKIMDHHGWTSKTSVKYTINSDGFRSDYDFIENEPCNLYLGCSYTFGEEVNLKDTWPSLVNSYLNDYKMYNLGVLGASTVTCYRLLKNVSTLFDIKKVFILAPYVNRKEMFYDNQWTTISLQSNFFNYTKNLLPFFDDNLCKLEKEMAIDGIKYICDSLNVDLYMLDVIDPDIDKKIKNDRTARDLTHFGIKTHKFIADKFIEKTKNE